MARSEERERVEGGVEGFRGYCWLLLKREKSHGPQEIASTKNEFCGVSLVCGFLLLEMGGKCGGL